MKFQLCSDLHLEFYPNDVDLDTFLTVSADFLCVAGDLCLVQHPNFKRFFQHFAPKYQKIFYISGNHEYYTRDMTPYEKLNKIIQEVTSEFDNVYYLNNQSHLLTVDDENILILGSTLWSLIPTDDQQSIRMCISDYRCIYRETKKYGVCNITPTSNNRTFETNRQWLTEQLFNTDVSKILVMTHHMPSYQLIAEKYQGNPTNGAFASFLDHLVEKATVWVCGHTHTTIQKDIKGCSVYINPKGYPHENPDYQNDLVIEI